MRNWLNLLRNLFHLRMHRKYLKRFY